jgi:choline dehydrogenase-like flavoprotein
VIGAGFAGLVAARELGRAGLEVIVLEARGRVGGRTWTDRRLGHDLELGGTWVHWVQPHAWAEMTRYGRQVTASPAAEEAFWLGAGGAPRAGTPDEFMALIADGQQAIVGDVRAAIPRGIDPTAGAIGGLDALSIADRFDAVGLAGEARWANEAVWAGHVNARLDQGIAGVQAVGPAPAGFDLRVVRGSASRFGGPGRARHVPGRGPGPRVRATPVLARNHLLSVHLRHAERAFPCRTCTTTHSTSE